MGESERFHSDSTKTETMIGSLWQITVLLICYAVAVKKLSEKFSWRTLQYQFDTREDMEAAKNGGYFEYGNSIITSIALSGDRMFLATPRLKSGVPSTLNYIKTTDTDARSPILKPYPTWEANEYYNRTSKKKTMVSIINVKVDNCDRLWALDTGTIEDLASRKVETPPGLFVYKLNDDTLIRKHTFKDDEYDGDTSKLRAIVVDDSERSCEKAYAYIADANGGLIVYNWDANLSYRVEHSYFHFDPLWGNLRTSRGTLHQLRDGLQAMALTLPRRNGHRDLLFHPLISVNEFSVSTEVLQNMTTAQNDITAYFHLGQRGPNMQSPASYVDKYTGVLLYTTIVRNALVCWNVFGTQDEELQSNQGIVYSFNESETESQQGTVDMFEESAYPADLTVDVNGTVWVLTNRFLDYTYEKKENNVAMRIYTGVVQNIIRGTPCDME